MRARSALAAIAGLSALALTACTPAPTSGAPQTEVAARAIETAVNQELTDYLSSPDQRGALAELLAADQGTNTLRDTIINTANTTANQTPGAKATVIDLPGETTPAIPTAFEITATGNAPWCVVVQQPAWTSLIETLITDTTPTPTSSTLNVYRASAGDCTASLNLYEDDLAPQTNKADLATAQADGASLAKQITMLLIDTTNMGSTPPNNTTWATLDETTGTLTLTPGAAAEGVVTSTKAISNPGTTITSSGMTGGTPDPATGPIWCITVDHNGQAATYTETGLQPDKNTCTADGIAVGPASNDPSTNNE